MITTTSQSQTSWGQQIVDDSEKEKDDQIISPMALLLPCRVNDFGNPTV